MKLTTFILILALTQVCAKGFGQKINLNEKDVSLEKILQMIRQQSGYEFFYDVKDLQGKKITVKLMNAAVEDAVKQSLVGFPLSYKILNKTIVLTRTSVTEMVNSEVIDPVRITGKITDSLGKPLEGATISVQRKTREKDIRISSSGLIVGPSGEFEMIVGEGDKIFITYIGYAAFSFTAKRNLAYQNIVLQKSSQNLTEVTVSTGYQKLSKERVTGSFAKPDMKVFSNRTGTMDVVARLEGQIAGLSVGQEYDIDVNTGAKTRKSLIRGTGSMLLSTEPLYVLNGVIIKDFSLVNIDDIDDITVLKDAAAAAIWGAQAANGVIVVNTKSGKKNQRVRVSYSGFADFQNKPDMNYEKTLNSRQLIESAKEIFDPTFYPYNSLTYSMIAPHETILYNRSGGKITEAQANASLDSLANIDNRSQAKDLFYRNTYTTNHTVSASGGNNMYSFYTSLGYTGSKGPAPGSNSDTYKIGFNQDFSPNDRITTGLSVQLLSSKAKGNNAFSYNRMSVLPYQLFKDAQGNNLSMPYMVSRFSPELRDSYQTQSGVDLSTYSPLDEVNYGYSKNNMLSVNAVSNTTIKLWKGLSFLGTYGYSTAPRTTKSYEDHAKYSSRAQSIDFIPVDGSEPYIPLTGGTLNTIEANQRNWTVRNQLVYNYTGREGKDMFTFQGGHEASESLTNSTKTYVLGWDEQLQTSADVDYKLLKQGVFNTITGAGFLYIFPYQATEVFSRFNSYFAMGSYTLNQKYTIDGSWRVDKSSLFGSDISAQNKPVYSIGGKWNMASENFMKPITWINQLALRATYGITGNSPYTGFATIYDVISPEQFLFYPQIAGPSYGLATPANRKLSWETSKTINLGVDFGILNGRLRGNMEYYRKNTSNLLGFLPLDPFTGLGSAASNGGDVVNRGWNISLFSTNITSKDFSWNTALIFSANRNKLLSYGPVKSYENQPDFRTSATYVTGYSYMPLFAYKYAGLDNQGDPQIYLADGTITKDPSKVQAKDLVYMGSTIPKFNGGMSNTFKYNQFTLMLNMVYNFGAVMRRDVNEFYTGRLSTWNVSPEFLNRWKKPGDENKTNIPGYRADPNYFDRSTSFYTLADINVADASYVKLRETTLGYDLNPKLLKGLKIQSASLFVQMKNIMLWKANKYGIDPEYHDFRRGTRAQRAGEHSMSIGVNINF
ncbi:SusC/RagA family TonB-linked outer membrane protein [Pedobacter steynii]|nr:SusC/RagA family TonB-linked outer membrane protein [Pedobacter steynii]NQX39087.1 SusC/RagA family TonB-linked outer membrane protein [Pedobacter steynii]